MSPVGFQSGLVFVYVREGSNWIEQASFDSDEPAANRRFGTSVAISGDTIVVGSNDDHAGDNSGSAYVFVRNGDIWTQQAKLTASDATQDDSFGVSVSISGDTIVVGAKFADDEATPAWFGGAAYAFVRNGTSWSEQAKNPRHRSRYESYGLVRCERRHRR